MIGLRKGKGQCVELVVVGGIGGIGGWWNWWPGKVVAIISHGENQPAADARSELSLEKFL